METLQHAPAEEVANQIAFRCLGAAPAEAQQQQHGVLTKGKGGRRRAEVPLGFLEVVAVTIEAWAMEADDYEVAERIAARRVERGWFSCVSGSRV